VIACSLFGSLKRIVKTALVGRDEIWERGLRPFDFSCVLASWGLEYKMNASLFCSVLPHVNTKWPSGSVVFRGWQGWSVGLIVTVSSLFGPLYETYVP
jgi:hypothetical protein